MEGDCGQNCKILHVCCIVYFVCSQYVVPGDVISYLEVQHVVTGDAMSYLVMQYVRTQRCDIVPGEWRWPHWMALTSPANRYDPSSRTDSRWKDNIQVSS